MRFTLLVRVHIWVNSYFFLEGGGGGTIGPIEHWCVGKYVPKTGFLAFIQPVWSFLRKKFRSCNRYPISHGKVYIHFCCPTSHSLKNGHDPKNFFPRHFGKYCFNWKNCYTKNIQNLISYKKVNVDFCNQTPLPLKMVMSSHEWFSQFFQHKLKNICEVFLLASILIWKKILWRINFVLTKFSPNALLFKKLQNECKNP